MTIQVDLPDLTQVVQGFGTIKNLSATYKAVMAEDKAAGYIQPLTGAKSILSQAGVRNLSEKIGQNPFEAIQEMFKNVPLINIETKDINLKIPNLTSEELSTYTTYLKAWINKNGKIEQDWISVMDDIVGICSTQSMKDQIANMATIKDQIDQLQKQTDYDKQTLATLQDKVKQNETCINLTSLAKGQNFITFKQNSALLINAVKENIQVLEQYKAFPGQLYDRIHVTDRYLAEISSVTSNFVTTLTTRLDVNANRFSQYVDAITLIVGAIKTRQVIIDFSVNRSEKCSKCSNDNYGSFPCSLSNLCPALPIFKIPPFKIPDINLDLSHLELGIDILLPKFNFVPIQIPLPKLPDLPAPPSVEVNRDIMYKIKLSFVDDLNLNMPTIPVIPAPPQLPELPSFIPNINLQLPVLPPAPRIPKILPDITATLKVANFVGKVFCIVK